MRKELFLQYQAQTSDLPLALEVSHAAGPYIYDIKGNAYLDLISGIGVSSLGHSHPAVIAAIEEQARKHLHVMVYGEYIQEAPLEFAKALLSDLPSTQFSSVYFTNSGAEATEGAMKLAKRHTGRDCFISFNNSYHGSTQGALSLSGSDVYKEAFQPLLPGITHLPYNDVSALAHISERVAAVFVEPVQGESGANAGSREFLSALRRRCTELGALLVYDECQTGLMRTGRLWQSGKWGIYPDIIVAGKALGGGLPLGAFITSREMMADLSHSPVLGHITTFGGHPLSCAAGLAAYNALKNEVSAENVEEKYEIVVSELGRGNVHGEGLMLSYDLGSFDRVIKTIKKLFGEYSILTDWFLFNDTRLRIAPPLNLDPEILRSAMKKIKASALD